MRCAPLQYPREWANIRRRSFLVGLPLIGPQASAYRDICAQLASRGAGCWSLWGPDETRAKTAQFVARALGEAVEWPNLIIAPEDPFELLFWDHKSCAIDDLSLIEAFMEIETHFRVSPSGEEMDCFIGGNVGSYIDFLLGRSGSGT